MLLYFSELSLVGLAFDLVDLQCYDTVVWVILPIKSSSKMTYNVSVGTLNSTILYYTTILVGSPLRTFVEECILFYIYTHTIACL